MTHANMVMPPGREEAYSPQQWVGAVYNGENSAMARHNQEARDNEARRGAAMAAVVAMPEYVRIEQVAA